MDDKAGPVFLKTSMTLANTPDEEMLTIDDIDGYGTVDLSDKNVPVPTAPSNIPLQPPVAAVVTLEGVRAAVDSKIPSRITDTVEQTTDKNNHNSDERQHMVDTASSRRVLERDPQHGVPLFSSHWYQRSLLVLTNTARMSPLAFKRQFLKDKKLVGFDFEYSETMMPVWRNQYLDSVAQVHADDMAGDLVVKEGCYSHRSCDGTKSMIERVKFVYKGAYGNITENIGTGTEDVSTVFLNWMQTEESRMNILDSTATVMGVGYNEKKGSRPGALNHQWVQNLVAGSNPNEDNPIIGATHVFVDGGKKIQFMANYFNMNGVDKFSALKSAELVLDQKSISLVNRYPFNNDNSSNYGTFASAELSLAKSCRSYFFRFVDESNRVLRYPTSGQFYTFREGDCKKSYVKEVESSRKTGIIITMLIFLGLLLFAIFVVVALLVFFSVRKQRENQWKRDYHQKLNDFLDEYQY